MTKFSFSQCFRPVAATLYTDNGRTCNNIYLNTHAKGIFTFSPSQQTAIWFIVFQCPVAGTQPMKAPLASDAQSPILDAHPNPADNTVTVYLDPTLLSGTQVQLRLTDVLGTTVWSKKLLATDTSVQIETRNLPNGVYQCHIAGDNGQISSIKIVVTH